MNIGGVLRALREERSWTQGQLAQRTGIPQQTISSIEQGKNPGTSVVLLAKLAYRLGISLDYLVERAGIVPARDAKDKTAVDLRTLAYSIEDEDIRRIILALPDIPADHLTMLALFVEVIRAAALSDTAPSVEPSDLEIVKLLGKSPQEHEGSGN